MDTVMHDCTLQIESFAEVLTLTGKNVSSILLHSPICATMFVEYAKDRSVPFYTILSYIAHIHRNYQVYIR